MLSKVRLGLPEMEQFAGVDVSAADARFTGPLVTSLQRIIRAKSCEVVLLGSIATGKYVDSLLPLLGERLLFPEAFVGRGDMSRGGLLLRCVAEDRELDYVPVAGAIRRGARPARLGPIKPRAPG